MKPIQILFLILFLIKAPLGFAELDNHSTGSESSSEKGPRATQAAPLTEREIKFIADHFFISKTTIANKYSEKLPQAIEKAIKDNNEKDSSQIISQLMGLVNKKQAQRVLESAKKEKESENAKKPTGGDGRYIALMERFIWGAKLFLKEPSKEESAEKYNQEFAEAFKTVEAKNEEILEKIKQAADGNDQAKDWLRKNLDQNSLLSFVEGQKNFGNGELADRIVDAMSFKEGKNKFLDISKGSETQRLHLGQSSKSASTAFNKFIENTKGFGDSLVAFKPHPTTPSKQWFVDSSGALRNGPPNSTQVSRATPSSANSSVASTTSIDSSSPSINPASEAHSKILQTCNKCHAGDVSIDANGILSKDGSPRSKAELLEAFKQVRQMAQPTAKLSAAERTEIMGLIAQWIK